MSQLIAQQSSDDQPEKAALEFHYEATGTISVAELADSFRAIDSLYARTSANGDRLSVVEIRSGSIFAVFAPYIPLLGQSLEVMNAVSGVVEFSKKLKNGIDWLVGRVDDPDEGEPAVAEEIAEILRPLSGKNGAKFGVSSFRYRSKTKDRIVEIEASYGSSEIDRAYVNAGRLKSVDSTLMVDQVDDDPQPALLKRVKMVLHQANAGPAKAAGQTGDRGIIKVVSEKKLPVYFANGINDLKGKMVKGARNPLKGAYVVDVIVTRENGEPKKYTVIEVHASARAAKEKVLPLLKATRALKPRTS